MKNCNLQFTMFPGLQVNKTYVGIAQNYKCKFTSLQVCEFKKIKSQITNHTLQSYKFTHYNITFFILKF
jgi:hypothetical protein